MFDMWALMSIKVYLVIDTRCSEPQSRCRQKTRDKAGGSTSRGQKSWLEVMLLRWVSDANKDYSVHAPDGFLHHTSPSLYNQQNPSLDRSHHSNKHQQPYSKPTADS